ncbi:MAG: STAS domain-containing protein [Gemmatimonadaceae bacterium]
MTDAAAVAVVEGPTQFIVDNRAEVRQRVRAQLEQGRVTVVVDLSRTEYVDSAGLGTLVLLNKEARAAGGCLVLVGLSDHVRDLLRLVRLDEVFTIASTVAEAAKVAVAC